MALSDVQYPLFAFDLVDAPLETNKENLNFQFWFLDLMKADKTNEEDALSDMIAISNDMVAALNANENDWLLNKNIQRTRIQDETADIVCGVMLNITLSQPINYNRCQIPTF